MTLTLQLALLACAAIGIGEQENQQAEVLRDWTARGVSFVRNDKGEVSAVTFPDRSRKYQVEDFAKCKLFKHLESMRLSVPGVPPGATRRLPELTRLRSLDLGWTNLAESELDPVLEMVWLNSLALPDTVTHQSLAKVAQFGRLESLICQSHLISDDDVRHLSKLYTLKYVYFGKSVTSAALAYLTDLKQLEGIHLVGPGDDDRIKAFSQFPNLSTLSLKDWKLSSEGYNCLEKFSNVNRLVMPAKATDDDFANAAELHKLRTLDLRWTAITDKGIEHLRGLKDLRMVNLSPTTSDLCLDHLVGLPRLISVTLRGPGFTDACIDKLITIKTLTYVDFVGTMVTPQGVARLRAAGPGLRVNVTKEMK
jgi:hypothetical protein